MEYTGTPALEHTNDVHLVGRVAADPTLVPLAGGELVASVRIVVERPRAPAGRGRRRQADTLTCAAWTDELRRTVMRWLAGDVVEVHGALRRRFWQAKGVAQSRYEVELSRAGRLLRPPVEASTG